MWRDFMLILLGAGIGAALALVLLAGAWVLGLAMRRLRGGGGSTPC